MHISKSYYLFTIIVLISVISVCGCEMLNRGKSSNQLIIRDIAYDVNKDSGYTVYIKENSEFVPYLVLTSDYNGETLLLRKEVLNKGYMFNDDSGYYNGSFIDKYLNNEFLACLDPELQDTVMNTQITVTSDSSLGISGSDTEKISRKVFLISCTEVNFTTNSAANKEGKPLEYFRNSKNRIALRNKQASSWWLRTSYTEFETSAWGISSSGRLGGGQVNSENGIRPAFCVKNTVKIEKSDKVISGQTVYIMRK